MADKMREILLSERGREIVNVVFFLSFLLRNRGIVFAAYVVWGIYLWFCAQYASSKASRIIYRGVMVFAGVMAAVNLYVLVR